MAQLDEFGSELLDDTPVAVPLQFLRPSMYDVVKKMVREQLSRQAQEEGSESFEEADDFDVGDDYDPRSPWELQFDQQTSQGTFEQEIPQTPPPKDAQGGPEGGSAAPGDGGGSPHKDSAAAA